MTPWRLQVRASCTGWARDNCPCPITLADVTRFADKSLHHHSEHIALEPNRYWNGAKRKGCQLHTQQQQQFHLRNSGYFCSGFIWGYIQYVRLDGIEWQANWRMMYWKEFERKRPWSDRWITPVCLLEGQRKTTKNAVRISTTTCARQRCVHHPGINTARKFFCIQCSPVSRKALAALYHLF
jgi:hypothetical protein